MRNIRNIISLCLVGVVLAIDNKIDVQSAYNEYCDICEDHTLCKFEGLGKTCEGSIDGGVTPEERKFILDTHNWHRRNIAKGLEVRGMNGSQPRAANMLKMEWDEELAKIAQHWADQCQFQHDTCRHDKRFKVGQNIYWNWRFPVLKTVNWTAAISSWYDEVDKFDPELVPSYEFNPETGHFTQLVWHDSALIGCGRRSYGPNKIYVCNYGPTGNWLNEAMYSIGEPCSACPGNTHCQDGLCAIPSEVTPESYEPIEEVNQEADFTKILNPPSVDAVSIYNDTEKANVPTATTQDTFTTILPNNLNSVDEEDTDEDEDIQQEIEEIKKRLEQLVLKLNSKKKHKKAKSQ